MKHIHLFEAFVASQKLNEAKAKVKLGKIDSYGNSPEKFDTVLDILKGAIGKTITGMEFKKILGKQFGEGTVAEPIADNKALKAAKVEVTGARISDSTLGSKWNLEYTTDTAFRGKDAGVKKVSNGAIVISAKDPKMLIKVATTFNLGDIIL
tara:strand:+ start:39 stop:494 length:456 start_codon:yes stop_codon:yes gene_type:complete